MKKILLSSDPNGNFNLLLPKISQLHKKNNFNFMLITGSVCPSSSSKIFNQLRQNKYEFPLPTYFIDCSDMSYALGVMYPDGKQICKNLWFLGRKGVKSIDGVNVGFINGQVQNDANNVNWDKGTRDQFSKKQARDFIDSCIDKQIDILLTNQWCPQYIPSSISIIGSRSRTISQICYQLSPRYHISATGNKYFRLPAFKGKKNNPTHFINVAEIVDGESLPKDKYLVAIQMDPHVKEVIENINQNILIVNTQWGNKDNTKGDQGGQNQQILNVKKSGFLSQIKINKPKREEEVKILDKTSFIMFEGFPQQTPNSQITQFLQKWGQISQIQVFKTLKKNKKAGIVRFKSLKDAQTCLKDSGKYTLYQNRIKFQIKQQNEKYRLKDCYLCIQNEKFDQSLLVFKGKFCYICVDKGPVSEYHFQIVPINHVSSTSQLQVEEQQQISRYRLAFQLYFNKLGYTFVCVQRNMKLSAQINHSILHCIPLKLSQPSVIQKFNTINNKNRLNFQPLNPSKPSNNKNDSQYYILLQINNTKFIRYTDGKDKRFEIGRQAICEIIDKPERLNWRDCQIGVDGVKKVIEELKKVQV